VKRVVYEFLKSAETTSALGNQNRIGNWNGDRNQARGEFLGSIQYQVVATERVIRVMVGRARFYAPGNPRRRQIPTSGYRSSDYSRSAGHPPLDSLD
jgi:hypothetical protein